MNLGFQWPALLALLALVPVAAAGYVLAERRRKAAATLFGNPDLVRGLVSGQVGRRRHIPAAVLVVALALLLVGMARPRASFSVATEQATVMLAIDTSGSMRATDVKPTRLDAARAAASAFIDVLPKKYRVGIVSFSDTAATVLGPTSDREAARAVLATLKADGGTAIGAAILRSLSVVRPKAQPGIAPRPTDGPPASILLLSDGAQTAGPATGGAATAAANAGVSVSTVTLGTETATVDVPVPGGNVERVQVTPDPGTLRSIAAATKGTFQSAPDAATLTQVYKKLGSQLAHHSEPREITAILAGAGAIGVLIAMALSLRWFRRAL